MTPFVAGLDLGRQHDYSALAIVEHRQHPAGWDPVRFCHLTRWDLCLRSLIRFPLGTPYQAVVASVEDTLRTKASGAPLVVDATGVGAAVLEMFRHPSIYLHPVVITGGDQVNYAAGRLHAPKAEIVTTLALLLEQDKFRLAHDLPLAAEFHREMTNFRVDARPAGRFRFGASRAGVHDDLVMAVALAAWFTVRQHPHVLHDAHAPPPLTLF
ncbi:MAG: hypothetical protein ACKV22_24385 [Bryobacteraceae bacterium]